jgi:putative transposase
MRKSKVSPEKISQALRQAEGGPTIGDIGPKLGMTSATFYRWKKQCAGLNVGELRELRALRDESTMLQRVVADLGLDKTKLERRARRGRTHGEPMTAAGSRCTRCSAP